MANSIGSQETGARTFGQVLFQQAVPLQRESSLFLIASVLDVLMTYMLLTGDIGQSAEYRFYESNPVANLFLSLWGVRGIVSFKFAMVAVVEVIAHVVALSRLNVARRLLQFGTLIVSGTVIYSLFLALAHR